MNSKVAGEALGSFYSGLFGWELSPAPGNPAYKLVAAEEGRHGTHLGGAISSVSERPSSSWRGPTRAEGYGGHVTVYVEVPDIDAALAEAERLGGRRMQGPDEIEGADVTIAKFNDRARALGGNPTGGTFARATLSRRWSESRRDGRTGEPDCGTPTPSGRASPAYARRGPMTSVDIPTRR